jgi:hypothetical protein
MGDVEYWFLKCKVCPHFHRGDKVSRDGAILNLPFDREIECPSTPGQTAQYQTSDWRPMTEAQWQELERKNKVS